MAVERHPFPHQGVRGAEANNPRKAGVAFGLLPWPLADLGLSAGFAHKAISSHPSTSVLSIPPRMVQERNASSSRQGRLQQQSNAGVRSLLHTRVR